MKRSEDEFVALHYHEILGYILDATERRPATERATWLDVIQKKLMSRLRRAYQDLKEEPK